MTELDHVAAHYYIVQASTQCHSSMASSRNEVRIFVLFSCQNGGKNCYDYTVILLSYFFQCYVFRSAVSRVAGGFEQASSVLFVIDVQIKPSHIGFALLKNILHYLTHSVSRDNQLPVLNIAVIIYLSLTVVFTIMMNCNNWPCFINKPAMF